jgi:hypothetical protein
MPPYGLLIVIASLPVFFFCWANCHTAATTFSEFVSCKFGNHCKKLEKITKLLKLQNFGWGGNLGVGEHCILCIFVNLNSISPYLWNPNFIQIIVYLSHLYAFPGIDLSPSNVNNLFFFFISFWGSYSIFK